MDHGKSTPVSIYDAQLDDVLNPPHKTDRRGPAGVARDMRAPPPIASPVITVLNISIIIHCRGETF